MYRLAARIRVPKVGKRRLSNIEFPNSHGSRHDSSSWRYSSSQPVEPQEQQPSATKMERNRLHLERQAQQQQAKEWERQTNLYKNAARAIPYWLANDVQCFELTMEALNLKSRDQLTGENPPQDGILMEYRQLYLDSIPSYFKSIGSGLSATKDDDAPAISPKMIQALDELTHIGFSDLQWAKNHRRMKEYQANYTRYAKKVARKAKQLQERQARVKHHRKTLLELEDSRLDLKEATESASLSPSSSLLDRAVGVVSSLFGSEMKNGDDNESVPVQSPLVKVERNMERQRRMIQNAEDSVKNTQKKLLALQTERDSFQPLLTDEEYERANVVVQSVLPDICQELATHIHQRHSIMIEQYQTLDAKTDLTKPQEWYMRARLDRRKIIFHGGPTNSGKTYEALERLKSAQKGLYLGPLRLLAAEVYENLTTQGVYTNLYTGQERREIPFSTHSAATVEMAMTQDDFDIVVIDEIQMISDPFRGFAWTRALLGLQCKEIHVCGGLEAASIVQKMAESCGDEFELQTYERFGDLQVATKSLAGSSNTLGSYKNVQPGDCVVAFARNDIFAIKREIEKTTKYKCCVIYGSLPPETRADQARRFNNPDSGYDILVASDAIGMGLNLNIRRVIFNSMFKSNGETIVQLDHSNVKQIAGRAGRRNSPFPNGEVTCRDPQDMEHLRWCMSTDIAPIQKAGLLPTAAHIEVFSEALQRYGLSRDFNKLDKILSQFSDMATVKGDYYLCRQTPMKIIAKWLRDLSLSISDKYTLTMAPVPTNCDRAMSTLRRFAIKHAAGEASGLSRSMIPKPPKTFEDLSQLCSIHNELELFLWLQNRFPGNVVEQQAALALKEQAISYISKGLAETERLRLEHCYIKRDARIREMHKKNKKEEEELELEEYMPRTGLADI